MTREEHAKRVKELQQMDRGVKEDQELEKLYAMRPEDFIEKSEDDKSEMAAPAADAVKKEEDNLTTTEDMGISSNAPVESKSSAKRKATTKKSK